MVSPHNTFARHGWRWFGNTSIRWSCRLANTVIVYSDADRRRVATWQIENVVVSPLLMYVPAIDLEVLRSWRLKWLGNGTGRVLLAPGYIRGDKGIDDIVRATAMAIKNGAEDLVLAVVGKDAGGVDTGRALAEHCGVRVCWSVGYVPMDMFAAAIAAADVVVLAHRIASQSGGLRIARQLGVPTIAPDVGGLSAESDVSYPPGDVRSLARAIANISHRNGTYDGVSLADNGQCVEAHLCAYSLSAN